MDAFKELMARSPDLELMNIKEAQALVFWSGAAAKWARLQVDHGKHIEGMQAQCAAWVKEGQIAGELELRGQQRLGKLAKETEQAEVPRKKEVGSAGGMHPTGSGQLPKWQRLGFKSEGAMKQAEFLEAHPDEVKEVIEEAKQEEDFISKGAVKAKVRAKRAEKRASEAERRAAENLDKRAAKAVKQENHGVAEYFAALKDFRDRLELTIEGTKRERWFAPESINIVLEKHNRIREMLEELEEAING